MGGQLLSVAAVISRWREIQAYNDNACGQSKGQKTTCNPLLTSFVAWLFSKLDGIAYFFAPSLPEGLYVSPGSSGGKLQPLLRRGRRAIGVPSMQDVALHLRHRLTILRTCRSNNVFAVRTLRLRRREGADREGW